MTKKSFEYGLSKDASYVAEMVEQLKAQPREKKPGTTTQSSSMQAIIDRPVSEDEAHWNRPMALNWKAVPDAKTMDEAVAKRDFDATQVAIQEDLRRKGRNSLGDAVSQGEKSITPEKRERAVEAFNYSKPTPITPKELAKAIELNSIQAYGTVQAPERLPKTKLTWFGKLYALFVDREVAHRNYSYVEIQKIKAGEDIE